MKKFINSIMYIGITPDLPFHQQNKIRIFNTASITIVLICTFYAFVGIFLQRYLSSTVTLIDIVLHSMGFVFVYRKKYKFAFHYILIVGVTYLCICSYLFGERSETHAYLIFMPVAAIIFFDEHKIIIQYLVFALLLLGVSKVVFLCCEPFYEYQPAVDVMGWLNLAFTSVLIFLGVKQFKNENLKFNQKVNLQRIQLKEKNQEITDSIHYAQRIQKSLMASKHILDRNMSDYFVLYRPKDIVSGDFYWAEEADNRFLLAVCDCTGHGVPGAFMSLLNIAKLNETVNDKKITRPDLVFNSVRESIIKVLNPEGTHEERKDGMDAVLCNFDFKNLKLEFTCANNPIYLLRKGSETNSNNYELTEYKTNKMPVGMYHGNLNDFTLQTVDLQKGDMVYIFTDGYPDQFGGSVGKKFKYSQLKELFIEVADFPVKQKQQIIEQRLISWQGNLEQVDDILVFGVRI